ncbi:MAG: hypothetical protein D6732_15110 [Methanobacteriota archaeon]|nr:MAG: hypothetical protein D6732_15110 [Euryarchaeota archaeon]
MGENLSFAKGYICPNCCIHWLRCQCQYIPSNIDLDRLKLPLRFTIIDIETTGMSYRKNAILEIGGVWINLKQQEIKPSFHAICNELPEKPVDPLNQWIFLNSNLSFAEVINAPHFNRIKDQLQEKIERTTLTAFNKPFDFNFLTHRDIEIHDSTTCLMQWTRRIMGIRHERLGTKVPTAQEAWNFLFPDQPRKEAHRALLDAEFEAFITLKAWKLLQRKF